MKSSRELPPSRGTLLAASLVIVLSVGLALLIASQRSPSPSAGTAATPGNIQPSPGYPGPMGTPALTEMPPALLTVEPPGPSGYPTATLLPDVGIHISQVDNLSSKFADLSFPAADSESFSRPALDGQTLVGEALSGLRNPFGSIVTIDLISGATKTLAVVADVTAPQISDQYIVWDDQGKLVIYDRQSQITQTAPVGDFAGHASLSGSVVVWENITNGQYQGLWGYDITAQKNFQVVGKTPISVPYKPLISGRWVVYENIQDVNGVNAVGLNAVNLDTKETIELGKLPYSVGFVPPLYAIDGPWVAWSEFSYNPDLYLFNLETREARTVTVPSCTLRGVNGNLSYILISRTRVVFSGCFQDMGYDLGSNKFFSVPVRTPGATPAGWALADNRLVEVQSLPSQRKWKTELVTATIDGQ